MDNKYSVYRQIRFQRTYRTLGKMSWWRVVLGIILIILVLLISGFVSERFASRGDFILAEKMMVYPAWMEKNKPETKAFIEAGVLFESGDFEAASDAFASIEDFEAAVVMKSVSNLRIASECLAELNMDASFSALSFVDYSLLSEEDVSEYTAICGTLLEHYTLSREEGAMDYAKILQNWLNDVYA